MTTTTSPFSNAFASFTPEAMAGFFPQSDSMGTLTRSAVEASTASARASIKGMQEAGQSMMSQMKEQMTLSVETGKKLSEVSSLDEAMKIQAGFMKSTFEANMKGFTELTELYTETMREAFAPLAKQAKKAAKSAKAT